MSSRRPTPTTSYRVVVGFDGSALAHHAVDYVTGRAEPEDTVVIVYAYGAAPDASEHRRSIAQAVLDTALSPTGPPQRAKLVLELRADAAPAALMEAAGEHEADYIVLGATGAGSLDTGLGSVANEVIRNSDRPVLVLPRELREALV